MVEWVVLDATVVVRNADVAVLVELYDDWGDEVLDGLVEGSGSN